MDALTYIKNKAYTKFFKSNENIPEDNPPVKTEDCIEKAQGLIEKAKKACSGVLPINKIIVSSSEGALPSERMLIIASPHTENGHDAFHRCYHEIFEQALKLDNEIYGKILLIPPINDGLDDFENKRIIKIAFNQACLFLNERPLSQVHFVNYRSEDKSQYDSKNFNYYQEEFQRIKLIDENITQRILNKFGQIERMQGDIIVVPVGNNFINQSQIIKNINSLPTKNVSHEIIKRPYSSDLIFPKECPWEIWKQIFLLSDIQIIGRMTRVCRIFEKNLSENNFWFAFVNRDHATPLTKFENDNKRFFKINHLKLLHSFNWVLTADEYVCLLMMRGSTHLPIDNDGVLAAKEFTFAYNRLGGVANHSFNLEGLNHLNRSTPIQVLEICLEEKSNFRKRIEKFKLKTTYKVSFFDSKLQYSNEQFKGTELTGLQISTIINDLLMIVRRKLDQITK